MLSKDDKNLKESGILLPLSSLPSKYGLGTLGAEAYRFIDFLSKSGQRYWQLLPLVPLGEGNSPYKSSSCFAGEILYIDIDLLVSDGLLSDDEIGDYYDKDYVDYDAVRCFKLPLIHKAVDRFDTSSEDYQRFIRDNSDWLGDYAVFMAALDEYGTDRLSGLESGIKHREPQALEQFKSNHQKQINFYTISQYLFFTQFYNLKRYAEKKGIKFIGDIPIYVSLDSSDVWAQPANFRLDRELVPKCVAGVPPDMFSSKGQLWGNPIYDWEYQKKTDYLWWQRRLKRNSLMYDVIRIDHFRAFADFYTIDHGAFDATHGVWEDGVDMPFWQTMHQKLGNINIVAEDLGGDSPKVQRLVAKTGFPNMKVLQFAFSNELENPHLPQNYSTNCVCYTGTHDNDTTLGWYCTATEYERSIADSLFPPSNALPIPFNLIKAAIDSPARLVIIPMQDWLGLGSQARMNMPGTPKGNWTWRMNDNALSDSLCEKIRDLTKYRN